MDRFYNKTEYSGLETHILNSYTNPLVQVRTLFKNPEGAHKPPADYALYSVDSASCKVAYYNKLPPGALPTLRIRFRCPHARRRKRNELSGE
jgi:hypothetical protein